jgi:hypothetical protein
MAYEHNDFTQTFEPSTGLRQYRAVTMSAAQKVGYPTVGGTIIGILVDQGTTGVSATNAARRRVAVCMGGVAKIEAAGSTLAAGDLWSASSVGHARAVAAGHYACGYVISGSSGSTNRILTVSIQPIGTT